MIDLCEPRHARYSVAVTVIMGSNMDAVVVDSSDVARECLKYLREHQVGVATFIPLDSVKVKDIQEHLRSGGGGGGGGGRNAQSVVCVHVHVHLFVCLRLLDTYCNPPPLSWLLLFSVCFPLSTGNCQTAASSSEM